MSICFLFCLQNIVIMWPRNRWTLVQLSNERVRNELIQGHFQTNFHKHRCIWCGYSAELLSICKAILTSTYPRYWIKNKISLKWPHLPFLSGTKPLGFSSYFQNKNDTMKLCRYDNLGPVCISNRISSVSLAVRKHWNLQIAKDNIPPLNEG